jgi:hypothetical protein
MIILDTSTRMFPLRTVKYSFTTDIPVQYSLSKTV